MVDGLTATIGVFETSVTKGDLVTILPNTPTAGVTTYKLVNKVAADYTSGVVGSFTGAFGGTIDIIEPITGTVLNSISDTGSYNLFTVDGSAASVAVFESSVQPGDTVVVTGTGADASHIRTFALTNKIVSGGVVDATVSAATFNVKPADVAKLGLFNASTGTPTLTVDGAVATLDNFKLSLSDGDTVTVGVLGGVKTIALTNKAPLPVSGQIVSDTVLGGQMIGFTYVPAAGSSTDVTTARVAVASITPTQGADTTIAEKFVLTFAALPFGLADNVTVAWTGTTGELFGKSVTVAIPHTGDPSRSRTDLIAVSGSAGKVQVLPTPRRPAMQHLLSNYHPDLAPLALALRAGLEASVKATPLRPAVTVPRWTTVLARVSDESRTKFLTTPPQGDTCQGFATWTASSSGSTRGTTSRHTSMPDTAGTRYGWRSGP